MPKDKAEGNAESNQLIFCSSLAEISTLCRIFFQRQEVACGLHECTSQAAHDNVRRGNVITVPYLENSLAYGDSSTHSWMCFSL